MKVRSGFVSNSSSSNFVIAYKKAKQEACPHCGRSDSELEEILRDKQSNNLLGIHYQGVEKLDKYYKDIFMQYNEIDAADDPEGFKAYTKVMNKVHKYANQDYEVMQISIPYHDDSTIDSLRKMKNIIFLNEREL